MLLALLLQQAFVHSPTDAYQHLKLHGHDVYISPAARAHEETEEAVKHLDKDLGEVDKLLPREANKALKRVKIWIEWDDPEVVGACFHPDADWLKEHGFNLDKTKGIEIGNVKHYLDWTSKIQPYMVLHELSHAYMNLVLGDEDKDVQAAYDAAVASKKYDSVQYYSGVSRKAYALNNSKEYFAELSEAYFGKNDFQPFNREEFKAFDPVGYAMIDQAWHRKRK